MMTGAREQKLMDAANMLLDARRSNTPIADLPVELQPTTLDEAYFVQDVMAVAYGEVGGWKIGAPTADATPAFAPMPWNWIAPSGSVLSGKTHRYRGLEAEIAFLLGEDLPVRATPYPAAAAKLSGSADMQIHGGFIYGPAYPEWKSIDFATERVTLAIDGSVRVERTGSNTSGNLMRLLPWLANEGAARTGGLKAGQWITTGSWTGNVQAMPGSSADVTFVTVGKVGLEFA
jgi:2-keto-4-pentenoate hydratase